MLSAAYLATATSALGASTVVHRPPAYLDPGSGSFLLQLLVAGILGGLFAMRAFWGRLKNRILREREAREDETESEGE